VTERCNPPVCVRPIGHEDECRPTWFRRPLCGAWLPQARATCTRRAGHAGHADGGGGHRSRWSMELQRVGPLQRRVDGLPGVCSDCRAPVAYDRAHWRNADGEPHVCGLPVYAVSL